MTTTFARPFRPIEMAPATLDTFDLARVAARLKEEKPFTDTGRNSLSIVRCNEMTVVITVLKAGTTMREHRAPGPATVVLISGSVDFEAEGFSESLTPNNAVVFSPEMAHAVTAVEDSAYLILIGGRRSEC